MPEQPEIEQPDSSLVDEARAAGKAYIDSFNGNMDAMIADLNRRTQQAGRTIFKLDVVSDSAQKLSTY